MELPKTARLDLGDDLSMFYRYSGSPDKSVLLLIHGYPTSSLYYKDLMTLLSPYYRLIAPDMPGFGFTTVNVEKHDFSFANGALVLCRFLDALAIKKFAMYIFDFGAPWGLRLALHRPDNVTAIISQNGNCYTAGLGKPWDAMREYWLTGSKNVVARHSISTKDAEGNQAADRDLSPQLSTTCAAQVEMCEIRSPPPLCYVVVDGRQPGRKQYQSVARAHVTRYVSKQRDAIRKLRNAAQAATHDTTLLGAAVGLDSFRNEDMNHIDHYIRHFIKVMLPVSRDVQIWWFQQALHDAACYNSMMYVSKAHQAFIACRDNMQDHDLYRHYGNAISCINQRLAESQEMLSDATLFAISFLAAHEVFFGSRSVATAHVTGLTTILQLRGKFAGGHSLEFLEDMVHWIDRSNAIASRQKQNLLWDSVTVGNTAKVAYCSTASLAGESGTVSKTFPP
ncbi:hypothetical protein KCU61_g8124, partial [Aureobasidium melanogenum]